MAQPKDQSQIDLERLWKLSGMGVELAAAIAGMGFLGWLLDRWLGSNPWLLIVGLVLGLIGGGYNFIRQSLAASRAANAEYRRSHPFGSPPPLPDDDEDQAP